jgi:hypothetical protein
MRSSVLSITAALLVPAAALAEEPLRLRATPRSQVVQNQHADAEQLSRMRDDAMLRRFEEKGYLVKVPFETASYYLHSIPGRLRYLRPWAKLFLERLSAQFHARFGARLRVTSLVRTMQRQRRLEARNGNAAAATGPRSSTHLTGATLDISKRLMTRQQQAWVRRVLTSLKEGGYLYAIEEFQQPAFHVMVYRDYGRYVSQHTAAGN